MPTRSRLGGLFLAVLRRRIRLERARSSLREAAVISSTAARNAASLAFDGLVKPLTLRTNWSAAGLDLVLGHRRLEVEERLDVSAHMRYLNSLLSGGRPRARAARAPAPPRAPRQLARAMCRPREKERSQTSAGRRRAQICYIQYSAVTSESQVGTSTSARRQDALSGSSPSVRSSSLASSCGRNGFCKKPARPFPANRMVASYSL